MHHLTFLLFIFGFLLVKSQAASHNFTTPSLGLGPTIKVPPGHIESSIYGWHLHFTAVTGRAIPWWSIYGCVAAGIGAARAIDEREHPSDPWVCESRNVKMTARPVGQLDLDLSLLSDGFELLSEMLDGLLMPNAVFQIFDYNVPKITCSVVWGNAATPVEVDGGGGRDVDVA